MEKRYVIDRIPPSNNEFIGQNKAWEYNKVKQEWCELVCAFCRPRPLKPFETATVTLIYHFSNHIRRDPDNYSGKFILDGLTHAGIIKDDNFNTIDLHIKAGAVSKKPYTEIIVTEGRECTGLSHGSSADFLIIKGSEILFAGKEEVFSTSDDIRLSAFRERFRNMTVINTVQQQGVKVVFVK